MSKKNYNNMTIRELREELVECDGNSVKTFAIKNLLLKKHNDALQNKMRIHQHRHHHYHPVQHGHQCQIIPQQITKNREYLKKLENERDEMLEDIVGELGSDLRQDLDQDFEQEQIYYDHPQEERQDNQTKFKEELEKDRLNNNLTERLNSNIYIQNIYKTKQKKNIVPAFDVREEGGLSAYFSEDVKTNDFSNKRLFR